MVCCTAVPVDERMWAKNSGERTWSAISRRLRLFQAGPVSLKIAGVAMSSVYQPMPNPSPFVVSTPIRERRLWSISDGTGRYSTSHSSTGVPE
ncbi:hypothetical protein GCM10020219_056710 [Nonomuraea dietziae]